MIIPKVEDIKRIKVGISSAKDVKLTAPLPTSNNNLTISGGFNSTTQDTFANQTTKLQKGSISQRIEILNTMNQPCQNATPNKSESINSRTGNSPSGSKYLLPLKEVQIIEKTPLENSVIVPNTIPRTAPGTASTIASGTIPGIPTVATVKHRQVNKETQPPKAVKN